MIITRRFRNRFAGILLALTACACGSARPADPAPSPPPASPPVVTADSPWRDLRVCVADAQGTRDIPVRYNVQTGDTLVDGRPFPEAYPTTERYVEAAEWYINNEPIVFEGIRYVKYGLPRILPADSLVPRGEYRGALVFVERDIGENFLVPYVAIRPGCEFHPYQRELITGGVRG